MKDASVIHGDCLNVLREFEPESVDAIVSDPPYGISFMGKHWDYDVPAVEVWAECLRVLKPGGHLLAFAGTRTQHRMAVRIEDAGFEVRDMIAWVYATGFPKSRDLSEPMRKWLAGERIAPEIRQQIRPGVYEVTAFLRAARDKAGWSNKRIDALFDTNGMAGHWTSSGTQPAVPSVRQWAVLKQELGFGCEMDALVEKLASTERPNDWGEGLERGGRFLDTVKLELGKTQGWGTALKPALEPITVARKPIFGTNAANVQTYGTGAINIDGCRITEGRWPSNLIHDGSADAVGLFPVDTSTGSTVSQSAARFFYCPKPQRPERDQGLEPNGNIHPTVKPTDLMRYLCRLVTPPGGTVLDPFTGSGSTGRAAVLEGFRFIGIERDATYVTIAQDRIQSAIDYKTSSTPGNLEDGQLPLFK